MLIINTTYQVTESHEEAWKKWVLDEYAPQVSATGILVNPSFFRLLIENEVGMVSYALQFEVSDLDALDNWFKSSGKSLQNSMSNHFDDKVLGFTTVMEKLL